MIRKTTLVVLLTTLVAGGALAWILHQPREPSPSTSNDTPMITPQKRVDRAPVDRPPPARIDASRDPRIANLRSEPDFTRYLDTPESEVRAGGSSTDAFARASSAGTQAHDRVRGDAIASHLAEFGERVHRIDREREFGRQTADLDSLAAQMDAERDPEARERLRARWETSASKLPDPVRIAARAKLH